MTDENRMGLARRLWIYQRERFPIGRNGLMIAAFTFSAAAFSRVCRGASGFIRLDHFLVGIFTSCTLFFLLRVLDEFKDAAEDARFRSYRPIPRGLIALHTVGWSGALLTLAALVLNFIFMPPLVPAVLAILAYMALMTREFFMPVWLRRHPMVYMFSHMVVMPLIDFYTTGLDWHLAGQPMPDGLWLFLAVTFWNGAVIEVGRKIRAPEGEEVGVETYSVIFGSRRATYLWLLLITLAFGCAWGAVLLSGAGRIAGPLLVLLLLTAIQPAWAFLHRVSQRQAGRIENAAGFWVLGMYLTLGVAPFILRVLGG
jgi:4-hydroxybenzoate polyprenyltransferase